MTQSDKRLLGVSILFGGVAAAAYLIAPEETGLVFTAAKKALTKKTTYSEVEEVEFVTVENPESITKEQLILPKKKTGWKRFFE